MQKRHFLQCSCVCIGILAVVCGEYANAVLRRPLLRCAAERKACERSRERGAVLTRIFFFIHTEKAFRCVYYYYVSSISCLRHPLYILLVEWCRDGLCVQRRVYAALSAEAADSPVLQEKHEHISCRGWLHGERCGIKLYTNDKINK